MLTQQEAAQALAALAKETVRLWNTDGTSLYRRIRDADDLDISAVIWSKKDSDDVSLLAS